MSFVCVKKRGEINFGRGFYRVSCPSGRRSSIFAGTGGLPLRLSARFIAIVLRETRSDFPPPAPALPPLASVRRQTEPIGARSVTETRKIHKITGDCVVFVALRLRPQVPRRETDQRRFHREIWTRMRSRRELNNWASAPRRRAYTTNCYRTRTNSTRNRLNCSWTLKLTSSSRCWPGKCGPDAPCGLPD